MVDENRSPLKGKAKTLSQAATEASNGPGSERESAVPVEVENEEPLQVEVVASPGDGVAPAGAAASSGEARGLPRRPQTGAVREPSIRVEIDDDEGPVDVKMDDSQGPVQVEMSRNQEPMEVRMAERKKTPPPKPIRGKSGEMYLPPRTTREEGLVTKGQRNTSMLWEISQSAIALIVTCTTVFVLAYIAINVEDVTANQLVSAMQLNVMATLILTFYFVRTNSHKVGGVGPKPTDDDEYEGR